MSFSLGERVFATQYLNWDEHIRQSNTALVNDWGYAKNDTSPNQATLTPAIDTDEPLFIGRNTPDANRKVFVVHGHAEKPKQAVGDFLRSVGLEPIILHEQPNQGRTIIEKFEKHSDVGFAVVLLTPDDFGGSGGQPEKTRLRARQKAGFSVFMVAAGMDLALTQEQALTDLHHDNPCNSSYAASVQLKAEEYRNHGVKVFKDIMDTRLDRIKLEYDPDIICSGARCWPKDAYRWFDEQTKTRGALHREYTEDKKGTTAPNKPRRTGKTG